MSATALGTYVSPPAAPAGLRLLRLVLVATACLTLVTVGGYLLMAPRTADRLGEAAWGVLPAVLALALSRRAGYARTRVFAGVLALGVLMLLLALARVAAGEVQGLVNLLLPAVMLSLLLRRDVRGHLLGRAVGEGWTLRPRSVRDRGSPRRLVLFRRTRAGDDGQAALELVAVLGIVAVVVGIGASALMAAPVEQETEQAVCGFLEGADCGDGGAGSDGGGGGSGGGGGGGGAGGSGGDGDGGGDGGGDSGGSGEAGGTTPDSGGGGEAGGADDSCSGFFGCALSVLRQVGSGIYQVVDAAVDDVVGIFELVMDPSQIVDALAYLVEHPGDALAGLFWDAESRAMWGAGDYGGAVGRLVWNVGSMFIPFVNAGKVASALGDLGRLSGVATSADELADLASAARRAEEAARAGDPFGAADIAVDARREADELAERARTAGCLSAGPVTLQVLAAGPARGAAPVMVVAGGGLCDAAGDAARRADEAADAAAEAAGGAVNSAGRAYPRVLDPRTGEPIAVPEPGLTRVPKADRVQWGGQERAAFIKEWYDRGNPTPAGGWASVDVHHIRPREYGGTNDFDNLVPVPRAVHQEQFNAWWRDY